MQEKERIHWAQRRRQRHPEEEEAFLSGDDDEDKDAAHRPPRPASLGGLKQCRAARTRPSKRSKSSPDEDGRVEDETSHLGER